MQIAFYIKKQHLKEDASIISLLALLEEKGCVVYNILAGLRDGTDLVISFGGDGTFLNCARMVAQAGVPLLGVNLGRMGFLSDARLEDVASNILSGNMTIEEREMLSVTPEEPIEGFGWPYAVNEVSVHRSGAGVLGVSVNVDGDDLPTYWADGLLVSTSSGSTAYSLSVGGPICRPDVRAFIIAPIAPHNLNIRPLITPESSRISLSVRSKDSTAATLMLDNRIYNVPVGTVLRVEAAPFKLKRVRLGRSNFIDALRSKLFWGEDVRNFKDQ